PEHAVVERDGLAAALVGRVDKLADLFREVLRGFWANVELLISRPDRVGSPAILQNEIDGEHKLNSLFASFANHLLGLLDSLARNEIGLVGVSRIFRDTHRKLLAVELRRRLL